MQEKPVCMQTRATTHYNTCEWYRVCVSINRTSNLGKVPDVVLVEWKQHILQYSNGGYYWMVALGTITLLS